MNKSILAAVMLAATSALLAFGLAPATMSAQDKAPGRTKWEYKVLRASAVVPEVKGPVVGARTVATPGVISDAALTALGEDGWELDKITGGVPFVSSFRVVQTVATAGSPIAQPPFTENTVNFTETVYYFKRAK